MLHGLLWFLRPSDSGVSLQCGWQVDCSVCHLFYCDLGSMLTSVFVIIMFHCSVGGMLTAVFVICFTAVLVM